MVVFHVWDVLCLLLGPFLPSELNQFFLYTMLEAQIGLLIYMMYLSFWGVGKYFYNPLFSSCIHPWRRSVETGEFQTFTMWEVAAGVNTSFWIVERSSNKLWHRHPKFSFINQSQIGKIPWHFTLIGNLFLVFLIPLLLSNYILYIFLADLHSSSF